MKGKISLDQASAIVKRYRRIDRLNNNIAILRSYDPKNYGFKEMMEDGVIPEDIVIELIRSVIDKSITTHMSEIERLQTAIEHISADDGYEEVPETSFVSQTSVRMAPLSWLAGG